MLSSFVDESGTIFLKKIEEWVNTVTPVLTYLLRCNTDVTSLKSGTAVKGVIMYITNYVTKTSLKTHVIFDTIRKVFLKNAELLTGNLSGQEKCRSLMTKITNQLSTKMELGGPMICSYLLGFPNHYTSHKFIPLYWQSFVNETRSAWLDSDEVSTTDPQRNEKLILLKKNNRVVGFSPVHDYIFQPKVLENMSLYDFFQHCKRDGHTKTYTLDKAKKQWDTLEPVGFFPFQEGQPLYNTHGIQCCTKTHQSVPNFVGAFVPRRDLGTTA